MHTTDYTNCNERHVHHAKRSKQIMAMWSSLTACGQMDKVLVFGHERRRFESSHCRPTSPLGGLQSVADLFLENGVHCCLMKKGIKDNTIEAIEDKSSVHSLNPSRQSNQIRLGNFVLQIKLSGFWNR